MKKLSVTTAVLALLAAPAFAHGFNSTGSLGAGFATSGIQGGSVSASVGNGVTQGFSDASTGSTTSFGRKGVSTATTGSFDSGAESTGQAASIASGTGTATGFGGFGTASLRSGW